MTSPLLVSARITPYRRATIGHIAPTLEDLSASRQQNTGPWAIGLTGTWVFGAQFSVVAGTPPPGTTINSSGTISIPNVVSVNSYNFTVRVVDSYGFADAAITFNVTSASALSGQYAQDAVAMGPLCYYRLGESAGASTLVDSSGNGQDGSYLGAPLFEQLPLCDLDGGDTAIRLITSADYGSVPPVISGSGFAVSLLVRIPNITGQHTLIEADTGAPDDGWSLEVFDGKVRAYIRSGAGGGTAQWIGGSTAGFGTIVANQIHHYLLFFGSGGARIFLDETELVLDDTLTDVPVANTSNLSIGSYHGVNGLVGFVDEVLIFDRLPSSGERTNLARISTADPPPTAVNDSLGNLIFNTGPAFADVLVNDTYSGTPSIEIISQTPSDLGATVNSNPVGILIPTGSLGAKSITYRLSATGNTGTSDATITADVVSTAGEFITTPEAQSGWAGATADGNNVVSDYTKVTAAFNQAVALASANAGTGRGVVQLVQGRTYVLHTASGGPQFVEQQAAAFNINAPNVEIRTQGLPSIASGNQAKIRFRDWAGQTGVKLRGLIIIRASNVRLRYLDIDGNKLSTGTSKATRESWLENGNGMTYTNPNVGGNGGVMNITVYGGTGIRIEACRSHDAICDGMYLIPSEAVISDMQVTDCEFSYNRRQGVSIYNCGISGGGKDQVVFTNCKFIETGDQPEVYGESPGSGVDIEPITGSAFGNMSRGISFYNCQFNNNHRGQMEKGAYNHPGVGRGLAAQFSGGNIEDLTVWDCAMIGNRDEAGKLNSRKKNSWVRLDIRRLTISGNGTNAFIFDATTQPADVNPVVVNTILVDIPAIEFRTSLASTGHSVDVWLAGRNQSTVSTLGKQTITFHAQVPS